MEKKTRGTLRRVIRLALPAVFENVMFTLVNIVDVAMVGSLGAVATAAAALNAQPMWLAYAVTMIAAGGASVLVARCWGAKDYALAGHYAAQAVMLGTLIGLCMTAAAESCAGLYVAWMRAAPDVAPDAAAYMRIVGASMPLAQSCSMPAKCACTGSTPCLNASHSAVSATDSVCRKRYSDSVC